MSPGGPQNLALTTLGSLIDFTLGHKTHSDTRLLPPCKTWSDKTKFPDQSLLTFLVQSPLVLKMTT